MTNSTLIAVFNGTIATQSVQLCNARDLHAFIESKQEYATWIKNRIADYGFIQDEDYIIVTERTHGRPRKEYHITLDMGKELGMVERNERGRQIRRYFIECEKRQLQNAQPNLPLAEPDPKPDVVIPYEDAEFIADYIVKVRVFAKEVELFHRKLYENLGIQRGIRNNLAAQGYDIAHEFNYWLDPFVDRVLPKTKPNKPYLIYNC